MSVHLPQLSGTEFRDALETELATPVSNRVAASLFAHYQELRLWAARTSLVGAGETDRLVERHYAEGLKGLPLVGSASRILDLGTGAGFPGWVLSAACPDAAFWLVESRHRKAAFLRSVTTKAGLSCSIVGARVTRRHPVTSLFGSDGEAVGAIDLVTVRAVRITEDIWAGLAPGLSPGARVLRWEGTGTIAALPGAIEARTIMLTGQRRIQEWLLPAKGR